MVVFSVVHEPARLVASQDSSRQEPAKGPPRAAKGLESARGPLSEPNAKGIERACGPLLEPTRAAKGIESACGPLFEPDAKGIESARAESRPGLEPGSARAQH